MTDVFYDKLADICNISFSGDNKGFKLSNFQNDLLVFTLENKTPENFCIKFSFFRIGKGNLPKPFPDCRGGFIIDRDFGFVEKHILEDTVFSFHEIMSMFFKFEIISLYQKLLKMTKPLL
jgi:hypothetical protein